MSLRDAFGADVLAALAVCCVFFAFAPAAVPAELISVSVDRAEKRYIVRSEVLVHAPVDQVYAVLADYDQFERVSSIFKDSHYIERDEVGNGLVFTRMHDCILFFCKTIERTETIAVEPPTSIVTTVIPEKSDVNFGRSQWRLAGDEDGSTRVSFEMQMEPDFWVPPVIGPFMIRRFLRNGSEDAAQRLEDYALELLAAS